MSMEKHLMLIFVVCLSVTDAFPQGEIDNEIKEFYRNERTLALEVNSQGWGFGFRYGRRINGTKKQLYSIDAISVRHLREVKLSTQTGRFIYGKLNSLYSIQATTGLQKEHFRKFDKGGVAIRSILQAGISTAFIIPYYYLVYNKDGEKEPSRYNPDNTDIYSRAFLYGIPETKILPGIATRIATNFEFSKTDKKIQALELGIHAHAYISKIRLMASNDARFWFVNLFIAYRFGKIIGRK